MIFSKEAFFMANPETAKHIRELLYNRKIRELPAYPAECVQSCEEESEKEKLKS